MKGKATADEDELIDSMVDDDEKALPKQETKGNEQAKLEKLDAQLNALREVMQSQQERFERHTEEIGELRSMLADREKQIRELEAKAVKASELVAEVQPESLMAEQKKTEAKIEALRAKLENGDIISGNIIEELKKIKNDISVFRGTEEIVKLNKEVRGEITAIKKIEANVEKHADRVDSIFSTFESSFAEFAKMKDELKDVADSCSALRKDIEANKVALSAMPKKDEFYQIKNATEKALQDIKEEKAVYGERNKAVEGNVAELLKKTKGLEEKAASLSLANSENMNKMKDNINEMRNGLENVSKVHEAAFEDIKKRGVALEDKSRAYSAAIDSLSKKSAEIAYFAENVRLIMKSQNSATEKMDMIESYMRKNDNRINEVLSVIERMAVINTKNSGG